MGHPMEYNLNNENKLQVGDKLMDDKNHYVVVDMEWKNTHSQYASAVKVECIKGPNKDRSMWLDHYLATTFRK